MKGIVGVYPRRDIRAEIDVGYRMIDPGGRQPAGGEQHSGAHGLLDPGPRRGDPSKLGSHRLVQSHRIEPVRCRRQAAERAVELDPEGHAADIEPLPNQRAAHKPGVVVVQSRAGVAPVGEALDIDDPVVRSAEADEGARVSPGPIESGIVASFRGTGARQQSGRPAAQWPRAATWSRARSYLSSCLPFHTDSAVYKVVRVEHGWIDVPFFVPVDPAGAAGTGNHNATLPCTVANARLDCPVRLCA